MYQGTAVFLTAKGRTIGDQISRELGRLVVALTDGDGLATIKWRCHFRCWSVSAVKERQCMSALTGYFRRRPVPLWPAIIHFDVKVSDGAFDPGDSRPGPMLGLGIGLAAPAREWILA